jgi:hypothetical protein
MWIDYQRGQGIDTDIFMLVVKIYENNRLCIYKMIGFWELWVLSRYRGN